MSQENIPNINLKVGETTQIDLTSIAGSTGYVWFLSHQPDCLWLNDIEYVAAQPVIPGRPVKKVFHLMGGAAGQDYIEFVQVRPWEPREIAKKTVYAVIVTE